jgi:rhodanese-related sulfurtransferase
MVSTITRDELKEKIIRGDKFYLVEVESAEHAGRAHIPGSLRLPLCEIKEQAGKVLLNRRAELVFLCQHEACPCAREAGVKFSSMGYESIRHYSKGVADWADAGYPVETDSALTGHARLPSTYPPAR